jgi:hypothetical protein
LKKIITLLFIVLFFSCNRKEHFEWDFNSNKDYVYSFTQISHRKRKTNKLQETDKVFIKKSGKIIISGKTENIADLSFLDVIIKAKYEGSKDTINQVQINSLIQGLDSKSHFSATTGISDFLRVLIPLPKNDLEVQNEEKEGLYYPLHLNESILNSKGFNTLLFSEYKEVNGRKCAVLNGDINVSKLKLPDYIKGDYQLSKKGKGTYYFDIDEGCYVKAVVKIKSISLIDNESTYSNFEHEDEFEINLIEVRDQNNSVTKKVEIDLKQTYNNTPIDVAKTVIAFLQKRDTVSYMDVTIPLEEQQKLFIENIKYNPQDKDTLTLRKKLTLKYKERQQNFLVRAGYILEIMKRDKQFDITKASIDTIYYNLEKLKTYGSFGRGLVGNWADVTVEMTYENETFYFEIPQILNVEDKWHLYYPEYYLRDEGDQQFIKKRVKEIQKQAEDFWK